MEVLVNRHIEFEDEHRRLLTAQVVLQDQLQKLVERVNLLTERVDRLTERVDRLAESQLETSQKLNALIAIVDEIIRHRPPIPS